MEIKKYFISQRIFGREYRLLIKRGNSGFLLGELLISTTVICIAMGALLSLMLVSLQWAQRWQIENEVLLESMTIRLTIVNFTKRADKTVTVGRTGQYILYDGVRWFGIEGTEARRVLSDGQKQALSSPTISPSWGRLIVTPL